MTKSHFSFFTVYVILIILFFLGMLIFSEKVLIFYSICMLVFSGLVFSFIYAVLFANEKKSFVLALFGVSAFILALFIIFAFFMGEGGYPPMIDFFNDIEK